VSIVKVTSVKSISYRGLPEEWSNSYLFEGTAWADQAAFETWCELFKVVERNMLPSAVTITKYYGYLDPDGVSDFSYEGSPIATGVMAITGGFLLSGDTADWLRWDTGKTGSTGKKIYLRKYFHPAIAATGTPDTSLAAVRTAREAQGAVMLTSGSMPSGYVLVDKDGDSPSDPVASVNPTTRTLKRRGKRPS